MRSVIKALEDGLRLRDVFARYLYSKLRGQDSVTSDEAARRPQAALRGDLGGALRNLAFTLK